MKQNLLSAARHAGKLMTECARYLGRTGLDGVDVARKLWLQRQRGNSPDRVHEIDRELESIRARQQTRWSDFRSLPSGRRRLIRIASWSAALFVAYALVPPSGPSGQPDSPGSARGGSESGGRKRVNVWEGDIRASKLYQGADGRVSWKANYHVRLREDCFGVESPTYCSLDPLELGYSIEANEVLNQHHYGVYSSSSGARVISHERRVIGKASGVLRLGGNAPDAFTLQSNLTGGLYKDRQAPTDPLTDLPHDSEAERYWLSCLGGVPGVTGQPAYTIRISMQSGYGSDDGRAYHDLEPEVLNPLLAGIERSGPDLEAGNLSSRSDHARPVLNFWLCGRMASADDDELSGDHTFASTHGFGPSIVLFNPDIPSEPVQVAIHWKLERKQTELEVPDEEPAEAGRQGLLPADLALETESAPDHAAPGERIRYQFKIENKGPADAQGVMLTIALGGAERFGTDASQGECTGGDDTVSCTLGALEKDATAEVTVRLVPRVAGTLDSTATVSSASPDPDLSNNLENVVIRVQPRE